MDLDNRTPGDRRSYARLCRDGAYRVAYRQPLVELYREANARLWDGALPPATGRGGVRYTEPPRLVIVRRVSVGNIPLETGRRWFEVDSAGTLRSPEGPAHGLFRHPVRFAVRRRLYYLPATLSVLAPLDPEAERRVLLHEMIHAARYFVHRGPEAEAAHGPAFLAELARLARHGEAWVEDEIAQYRAEGDPPSGRA